MNGSTNAHSSSERTLNRDTHPESPVNTTTFGRHALEALRQIGDPLDRARQAGSTQDDLQRLGVEVSRIRREAIEEAIRDGMTKSAIAAELGMTRGRIGQLVSSGPPPERLFFGDDRVTVAMGGKLEAGKSSPGQVLASEDVRTFTDLTALFKTLSLDATHEVIPPPGIVNLNRDNLFVICGPRLSPVLHQILESDPYLGFGKDEDGWYLTNKSTGDILRSPQDAGGAGRPRVLRTTAPARRPRVLPVRGRHPRGWPGRRHPLPRPAPRDPVPQRQATPVLHARRVRVERGRPGRVEQGRVRRVRPRGAMTMHVTMHTEPGSPDKPNEDWCGANDCAAVVLDGVTAPPELPTGCIHGVPWYVDHLGRAFLAAATSAPTLADALETAIATTRDAHAHTCDLTHDGTPSATVAAARWGHSDQIEILVLSDATAVIQTRDGIRVISDKRLDRVAKEQRAKIKDYPLDSREHRDAVLDVVREQRRWRNKPGGYWLAAARPEVAHYAVNTGARSAVVSALALMSDGVSCLVDDYHVDNWEDVIARLRRDGPDELISHVRAVEGADEEGSQWARYKSSDDAAAIIIQ